MKSRIDKSVYKYTKFIDVNIFTRNGKYHREKDLPAVIYTNGTMCWYVNSKLTYTNGYLFEKYESIIHKI